MPFQVRRRNALTGATVDSPQQYNTGPEAFDAAMDNIGTFIKNGIRGSSPGDNENPKSDDSQYKIYVRYRAGQGMQFELRYDFETAGDWQTNSLFWLIREVP